MTIMHDINAPISYCVVYGYINKVIIIRGVDKLHDK